MSSQTILNIGLMVHLIALAMAGGVTLVVTATNQAFWKLYDRNREQGLAAFAATMKLRIFGMAGLGLLILSGVLMLWTYEWTLASLLWFKVKIVIVLLLFVNGFTLGRTTALQMEKVLKGEAVPDEGLRKKMQIFQITQLSLFVVIIILAVFRFV